MMNLIELKFFLEDEIYLVPSPNDYVQKSPRHDLTVYGENKKGIICLIDDPTGDFNKSKEYGLLLKIMEAAKLTLLEFGLINLAENKGLDYAKLTQSLHFDKALLFGADEFREKFFPQATLNQPLALAERQILCAETLQSLLADRSKKAALWSGMKQLFGIK